MYKLLGLHLSINRDGHHGWLFINRIEEPNYKNNALNWYCFLPPSYLYNTQTHEKDGFDDVAPSALISFLVHTYVATQLPLYGSVYFDASAVDQLPADPLTENKRSCLSSRLGLLQALV